MMPVKSKVNSLPIAAGKGLGLPKHVFANARLVESSHIEYVAWPTTGEPLMIVKYKDGGVYGYLGVPRQKVVAAANAKSTGRYIARHIKGHYKPVKIEGL